MFYKALAKGLLWVLLRRAFIHVTLNHVHLDNPGDPFTEQLALLDPVGVWTTPALPLSFPKCVPGPWTPGSLLTLAQPPPNLHVKQHVIWD